MRTIPAVSACLLIALLSSASAGAQGLLTMSAEQRYTTNPDESLVNVNGQVRKIPASATGSNSSQPSLMTGNLSVLGAQANFDNSGLLPASGVEVRFWQPDRPAVFYTAQTDAQGNYVIGLGEGEWVGEACGSGSGFYPAAWRLSIMDEKLVSMQAQEQKNIQLNALASSLVPAQSTVTLNGRGFGCNGSLVITYSNAVDRCGAADPVRYDHADIRISDFVTRSDTQLRFILPQLDSDRSVGKHIASIRYQQGNVYSRPVMIGERVQPDLDMNNPLCLGQQPQAAAVEIEVVTNADGQPVFLETPNIVDDNASATDSGQNNAASSQIIEQDLGVELTIRNPLKTGFGGGS